MRFAVIQVLDAVAVGPQVVVSVGDDMTAAALAAQLGGIVASPSPTPSPSPAPTPPPDANLPWWQQRPFDAVWIVTTIAQREGVSYEHTDAEKLAEKHPEDRAAYVEYLERYYHERAQD